MATGVAALGTQPASKSLGDGPKPVRERPLKADYWGTQFYDEKELEQLTEVHSSRLQFRCMGLAIYADPLALGTAAFADSFGRPDFTTVGLFNGLKNPFEKVDIVEIKVNID